MSSLIAPSVCLVFVALFFLSYQRRKFSLGREDTPALLLKAGATFCCALLSFFAALRSPHSGQWLLASGLFISTLADFLLGKQFFIGMGCFALGHFFYGASFIVFSPPSLISLLCFFLFSCGILLLLPWAKKHSGGMPVLPFMAYGLVLAAMLSLAVAQSPWLFLGGALFVLSDLLLGRRIALNILDKSYDYLCLGCYYLAQLLLAAAPWLQMLKIQ